MPDNDIERPRSYLELLLISIRQRGHYLYLLGLVFFSMAFLTAVVTIVHVHVAPVPILSSAEASQGVSLADKAYMPGVYLSLALYLVAGLGCLYELVTRSE